MKSGMKMMLMRKTICQMISIFLSYLVLQSLGFLG